MQKKKKKKNTHTQQHWKGIAIEREALAKLDTKIPEGIFEIIYYSFRDRQ